GPAVMQRRHALQMHELLMVRAVVVHDVKNRNPVMRGGPQNTRRVEQVSVRLERHREESLLTIGKRDTQCAANAIAHALAASAAEHLAVMDRWPQPPRPCDAIAHRERPRLV